MKLLFSFFTVFVFSVSAFSEILKRTPLAITGAHGFFITEKEDVWIADTFRSVSRTQSLVYSFFGNTVPQPPVSMVGGGGIAKHPSKDLYSFCDTQGSKVYWMTGAGELVATFSITAPWNARWSPSGDEMFVVSGTGGVHRIDENNQVSQVLSQLDAPFDVVAMDSSQIWVSEMGQGRSGKVCRHIRDAEAETWSLDLCHDSSFTLDVPEGMWPLPNGALVAVDTGAGKLVRIEADGTVQLLEEGLGIPILVQMISDKEWMVYANQFNGPAELIHGAF